MFGVIAERQCRAALQYFVMAVCASSNDASPECLSRGVRQAGQKLAEMYVQAYFKGLATSYLRVVFPSWVRRYQQIESVKKMEKEALAIAEANMRADIATLTPFDWRIEQQRALNAWWNNANSEANAGTNWTHDAPTQSHVFGSSNALGQLKHVNLRGRGSN